MKNKKTFDGHDNTPKLWTRGRLADAASVCCHTIARWEKRGLIRPLKINARVVRYEDAEVQRFLASAKVGTN